MQARSAPPGAAGLSGENFAAMKGGKSPPQFRLGRACPGHPRLGAAKAKTVDARIKSAQDDRNRFAPVRHKGLVQEYFPRTTLGAGSR